MSLASRVEAALAAGGVLASRWPRFEARDGQRRLARDIAETLELGGVRLAEAPTGVGKSMAYLLPAVLHALESGERVVVATATRSLQDQLVDRDLPRLLDALGARLPAARLKGKANYVCPAALERLEPPPGTEPLLDALRAWAADDRDGDLDRFPLADADGFRALRPRVGADRLACTGATCRRARDCAWVRARRAAAQAKLVIVNHALLAVSAGAEGLLPEFDVLIVDEAHRLESVLLGQLERSVSRHRVEELARTVGTGRRGTGLVPRLLGYLGPMFEATAREAVERTGERVTALREAAGALFAALPAAGGEGPYAARIRHHGPEELFGRDLDPLENALQAAAALERGLRGVALAVGTLDTETARELAAGCEQAAGLAAALREDLDCVTGAADAGWVYWRTAGARGVELHASPIHAGALTRRLVTSRARAVVFTSATLRTHGSFDFVCERLGLGEEAGVPCATAVYPTPFPLATQTAAFVLESAGEESEVVARAVLELSRAAPRNLLALFTAHERLRRARERLRAALPPGRVLLGQDLDGPAAQVAERFRLERGAILLGVQSLWEGVDFPGDSLEVLVVAKLPFAVPDDPLALARAERLRERGLEPFRHDSLPEAVLRFRQGVGRLIRRADDRGVLVVCDPRLVTASYRRAFLDALPVPPERHHDPAALAARAARFLADPVAAEGR